LNRYSPKPRYHHCQVASLRWKLVRPIALVVLSSFFAFGAIRPSFFLEACSWDATEIVVLEPTSQAGTFRVIEAIKGALAPGASLELPGLTPSQAGTARLSELVGGLFDPPFEDVPPVGQRDRMVVFLRRPGALPDYNPRPDLAVETAGWQPADLFGDLRSCAVSIQDGVTYGFRNAIMPGPTQLSILRMSETELRNSIRSVLQLRDVMDRAVANTDSVGRSLQLAALVRSGNSIARMSALRKLDGGGAAETNVLLDLLSDQSLLGWHQDIIGELAGNPVAENRFAGFLSEETAYWSRTCRGLKPGWWGITGSPEIEMAKSHYTRAYALLEAIRKSNIPPAMPVVQDFAAVWRACPREKTDQIAETLKLMAGH
jgi:hypothetical protein